MIADLARASRPLSWINTAYPFAVAYLLTTGDVDAALVIGTLFFLVPYNLALYGINDVFDYGSDLANPRKGGVEGALLPPARHRTILVASVVTCVPFVVVLVLLGPPLSWVALAVSLFALVAYSAPPFRFKEVPVLDSLTSSVHFVSPAVYGLTLAQATPTPGTYAVLGAFLLWGMASHAFGAVQDVVPDRKGGIASIATALGAARTVRFALAAWAAAGLLVATTGWPGALAGLLVLPYLALALPYARVSDEDSARANGGWRHFLWVNYAVGTAVTMFVILHVVRNGGLP
jgi:4-hydroxybenzoate polyprenyltransferase